MRTGAGEVSVRVDGPRVVVAIAHRAMRALIVEFLARDRGRWAVSAIDGVTDLRAAVASPPAAVVVDAADFEACCDGLLGSFPLDRVVVIGPEPEPAYRRTVLDHGAGAWLTRENVAEELPVALRNCLGSAHGRGPPGECVVPNVARNGGTQ